MKSKGSFADDTSVTLTPNRKTDGRASWLRVGVLLTGYLVALLACLCITSLKAFFPLFFAGVLIVLLASHGIPQPPASWRSALLYIAGGVLIPVVLFFIGADRVRLWKPNPMGYVPAWICCVSAFRHVRHMVSHPEPKEQDAA